MGPDGSCNIAQENVKGEEIPMKMITLGLHRYQSSRLCLSSVKWATGTGFSLLDLLSSLGSEMALITPSSTQDASRDEPRAAAPQLCSLCLGHAHRGTQDPSSSSFLYRNCSSRKAIPSEWQEKSTEVLWAVFLECDLSRGRGHPLVKWLQRTKPLGHRLTLKIIASILVPGHLKVLQIKIPIAPRPEKSKDF